MSEITRVIHQHDAIKWLQNQDVLPATSFITSMPDFSEFPSLSLAEWKKWFVGAAKLIMEKCDPNGVVIFYQRDTKHEGVWVNKAYLCEKAAEEAGLEMLWHKIICRVPPGNITFGKPGFSHLLCFSRSLTLELSSSTTDVITQAGKVTWPRGMGNKVCELACEFVKEHTQSHTIVDPFCGHGVVLSVANQFGLNSIGVELSRKRAERARNLTLPLR